MCASAPFFPHGRNENRGNGLAYLVDARRWSPSPAKWPAKTWRRAARSRLAQSPPPPPPARSRRASERARVSGRKGGEREREASAEPRTHKNPVPLRQHSGSGSESVTAYAHRGHPHVDRRLQITNALSNFIYCGFLFTHTIRSRRLGMR